MRGGGLVRVLAVAGGWRVVARLVMGFCFGAAHL
jgi:hypothetical protein